jgi:hypothetical protein
MAPVQNGIQQYVKLLAHIQEEDELAGAMGRPLAPPCQKRYFALASHQEAGWPRGGASRSLPPSHR